MGLYKLTLPVVLIGLITACGGGSSDPDPTPTPSSSSSATSSISTSSVANDASSSEAASSSASLTISKFIVVDQFGYLPDAAKVAVIRDPQTGFDAAQSFTPGAVYKLINLDTGETAYSAAPIAWNNGAESAVAGDKTWWFDFSSVTTPGTYAVLDEQNNVRSPDVRIGVDVYKAVLKHAARTFYYQRAGLAKELPYAETGWTDNASHLGACQDTGARLFKREGSSITGVAGTEKDLSGGWFDAGDYNKYTNWHAHYLVTLLHSYLENPAAWEEDLNIPESGDDIPDIVDEIKWGFDWLVKMQNSDGSVLSILGLAHASPPSAATGCSYYGPASTSATLSSAAAFAFGAKVFAQLGAELEKDELITYAADMKTRAEQAWDWAIENPDVRVNNNQGIYEGLGAGDQEVCRNYLTITNEAEREKEIENCAGQLLEKKMTAAVYLYGLTEESSYKTIAEEFINANRLYWVSHWNESRISTFFYYASLPGVTPATAQNIRADFINSMNPDNDDLLTAYRNNSGAYRAHMASNDFTWGSNRSISQRGTLFHKLIDLPEQNKEEAKNAALSYLHYFHGTNPLGMVYLSNMYSAGAHNSVNEFYHSWFANGSDLWDRVGESDYGPAPGFLVGGPNPSYNWDGICVPPSTHPDCGAAAPTPPKGQPAMKSYLDFNTSWPLNSWQITENHNDYQVAYIRLLSNFVK